MSLLQQENHAMALSAPSFVLSILQVHETPKSGNPCSIVFKNSLIAI